MKQLKHFNQFISEELGKDEENELKSMGFSNYSAPFKERYQALVEEWGSDPEVNEAIDTLKDKFRELFANHIDADSNDDAEEIEQLRTWMYDANGIDDIGWFEYIFINDLY
jgi:lipoate-protein ligase A